MDTGVGSTDDQPPTTSTPQVEEILDDEDFHMLLFGEPDPNKGKVRTPQPDPVPQPETFPVKACHGLPFNISWAIYNVLTAKDERFKGKFQRIEDVTDHISALYLWGSHLWGTNHEGSDYDFVLLVDGPCRLLDLLKGEEYNPPSYSGVSNDPRFTKWTNVFHGPAKSFLMTHDEKNYKVDIAVYDRKDFEQLMNQNTIWTLVFPFIPQSAILYESKPLEWTLNKKSLLFETLNLVSQYKMVMEHHYKNGLYHKSYKRGLFVLQHLGFAVEIMKTGKISDIGIKNEFRHSAMTDEYTAYCVEKEKALEAYWAYPWGRIRPENPEPPYTWEEFMMWFDPFYNALEKELIELADGVKLETDYSKMIDWVKKRKAENDDPTINSKLSIYRERTYTKDFRRRWSETDRSQHRSSQEQPDDVIHVLPPPRDIDYALQRAVEGGNISIIFELLREGANPAVFNRGYSIFETCLLNYETHPEVYTDIVWLFLVDGRIELFMDNRASWTTQYDCGNSRDLGPGKLPHFPGTPWVFFHFGHGGVFQF